MRDGSGGSAWNTILYPPTWGKAKTAGRPSKRARALRALEVFSVGGAVASGGAESNRRSRRRCNPRHRPLRPPGGVTPAWARRAQSRAAGRARHSPPSRRRSASTRCRPGSARYTRKRPQTVSGRREYATRRGGWGAEGCARGAHLERVVKAGRVVEHTHVRDGDARHPRPARGWLVTHGVGAGAGRRAEARARVGERTPAGHDEGVRLVTTSRE